MNRLRRQLLIDVSSLAPATQAELREHWPQILDGGCVITETSRTIFVVGPPDVLAALKSWFLEHGLVAAPGGDNGG